MTPVIGNPNLALVTTQQATNQVWVDVLYDTVRLIVAAHEPTEQYGSLTGFARQVMNSLVSAGVLTTADTETWPLSVLGSGS